MAKILIQLHLALQGTTDDETLTEMGNAVSPKMQQIALKHQTSG